MSTSGGFVVVDLVVRSGCRVTSFLSFRVFGLSVGSSPATETSYSVGEILGKIFKSLPCNDLGKLDTWTFS